MVKANSYIGFQEVWFGFYFEDNNTITIFHPSFPPSTPSYTLLNLQSLLSFLLHAYIYIHIPTYIYIPKYNILLNLYNVASMYVFRASHFGTGQPTSVFYPGEGHKGEVLLLLMPSFWNVLYWKLLDKYKTCSQGYLVKHRKHSLNNYNPCPNALQCVLLSTVRACRPCFRNPHGEYRKKE